MVEPYLPGGSTLVDVCQRQARSPSADRGFRFLGAGEEAEAALSYADLDRRARAVAVELGRLVQPGSRALLHYQPGLEFLVGFFGCLYAGVIAVPAAPVEGGRADSVAAARLRAIVRSARPEVVLSTWRDLADVPASLRAESGLARLHHLHTDQVSPTLSAGWVAPPIGGGTTAYLQYSSGSTGEPKGVAISHRNVLANLASIASALDARPESHGCFWLPMFHDMGLVSGALMPVLVGGDMTLMAPMSFLQRPHRWLAELGRPGSVTAAPNFAYDLCVSRLSDRQRASLDLSGLTCAIVGAERVRPATLARFAAAFGPVGFRAEAFMPCYGLAESVLMVTAGRLDRLPAAARLDPDSLSRGQAVATTGDNAVELAGSGSPRPGTDVVVADPQTLQPCPPGRVGEVFVSGPSVADGYWGAPAETAETFGVTLPGRSDRYLRTGDLGTLLDGELYVTGRRKDVVIVDGRNHHPSDLEETVDAAHPALRSGFSTVVSVDDGHSERVVVLAEVAARALRVPQAQGHAEGVAIEKSIRAALSAAHGLAVADVLLLRPGTLPFTSSGKLRRFACRTGYAAGGFDAARVLGAEPAEAGAA